MSYENRDVSIIVDGEHGERRICTVLLNNGRYGGGGMMPAPNADPGDGTIHEIVNGFHEAGGGSNVAVGIVNTGTGADYIRTIGVPRRYKEAYKCLLSKNRRVVDLGVVEYTKGGKRMKRLFVNFAGIGFDAEVVKATTEKFKALGDMPSYLVGLFSTLMSYENRDVSIVVDGGHGERRICTILLNNGRGGGGGGGPR